jgi:hypothetical protein
MAALFNLHGKPVHVTRHALDGANAEDVDVFEVYQMMEDHVGQGPLDLRRHLLVARGPQEVILRYVEREHAYYVLSISARRRPGR